MIYKHAIASVAILGGGNGGGGPSGPPAAGLRTPLRLGAPAVLVGAALLLWACATAPRREAAPLDGPFALRDPAVALPPGTLSKRDAETARPRDGRVRAGEVTRPGRGSRRERPAPRAVPSVAASLRRHRHVAIRPGPGDPRAARSGEPAYVPAAEALAESGRREGRLREALDRYARSWPPCRVIRAFRPARRRSSRRSPDGARPTRRRPSRPGPSGGPPGRLSLVELEPKSPAGYRFLARAAEAEAVSRSVGRGLEGSRSRRRRRRVVEGGGGARDEDRPVRGGRRDHCGAREARSLRRVVARGGALPVSGSKPSGSRAPRRRLSG